MTQIGISAIVFLVILILFLIYFKGFFIYDIFLLSILDDVLVLSTVLSVFFFGLYHLEFFVSRDAIRPLV